mmetsp:Transcript_36810/g.75458  ORF Transcript_36810/g.75458 Transcript_36810/m.75458 type:complete len:179 (+) Transcript_36810:2-538(+)
MHYACESGHTELISFLLHQGTDIRTRDAEGMNAMHTAAKHGSTKVMDLLMTNDMEIDVEDATKWTPLHHACCAGQNATVSYLLEKKANVNQKNANEETPLHLAFGNGHMEIIRLLLQADPPADKELKDNIGYTPMKYATIELAERMATHAGWGEEAAQTNHMESTDAEESAPSKCSVS